jgi:hypothetical protein
VSIERFKEYAVAFERAYETDDWSVLEPLFTDDATYEIPGGPPFGKKFEGRDSILAGFRVDVNSFDRKFDVRIAEFVKPIYEEGGVVHGSWRATYRKAGVPDLVFEGEEQACFRGDQMYRLVSVIDEAQEQVILDWISAHAGSISLEPADKGES